MYIEHSTFEKPNLYIKITKTNFRSNDSFHFSTFVSQ